VGKPPLIIKPAVPGWVPPPPSPLLGYSAFQVLPSLIPPLSQGWEPLQAWERLSVVVPALPLSDRYIPPTGFALGLPLHLFSSVFTVPGSMLVTRAFVLTPPTRPDRQDHSQSTLGCPTSWTGDPVFQVCYLYLFRHRTQLDANTTIFPRFRRPGFPRSFGIV